MGEGEFDQSLLMDRRMWRESELGDHRAMLLAALHSPNFVAYSVDFHGSVVTALGYQRAEDEIVPLCILLPEEEWMAVNQVTENWHPLRTPNGE